MSSRNIDDRSCTFCSKSRGEVQNLIAGPGEICICGECVEICNQILGIEKKPGRPGPAPGGLDVPFEFADFSMIAEVPGSDGVVRRAYAKPGSAPLTFQLIEITAEVRPHYHRFHAETYYFIEGEGRMELEGKLYPVKPGMSVTIRAGTRHRAVKGSTPMKILSVVFPPLDEPDELFE